MELAFETLGPDLVFTYHVNEYSVIAWPGGPAVFEVDRRLLHRDVTDDEARAIRTRITAEPATALFTVPFVFTPIFWELAWFTYPAVRRLFSRRGRRTFPTQR